jgi:pimeloyl-ACP methyl ester carboxylesterase
MKNPPLWRESLAGIDWLALRLSPVYYGVGVPQGDGSPVVVIPGCFATDASLHEIHSWLSRLGYRPYFSGIGINARCPSLSVEMLVETVDRVCTETGRRVTLIGHSRGGLLARGAAMQRPEKVGRVITLGSPVNGLRAHPVVLGFAELFHGSCDGDWLTALQEALPPSIEEVNVYTRDDGVVDWLTCFREDAETIEVRGTHVGLVFNPEVYQAVAELLTSPRVDSLGRSSRQDWSSLQAAA